MIDPSDIQVTAYIFWQSRMFGFLLWALDPEYYNGMNWHLVNSYDEHFYAKSIWHLITGKTQKTFD